MRFNTIQDFLMKFSACPFCQGQCSRKIWNRFNFNSQIDDNSYLITDEMIELFVGSRDNKVATIALSDNKVTSYIDSGLTPNLFNTAMKLVLTCNSTNCQMKGFQFKAISYPLRLDIKNLKIFYPLLDKYCVTVPLGTSSAEYEYNMSANRLRLTVFKYQTRAANYTGVQTSWNSLNNQIDYRNDKVASFLTDLPITELEKLQDKEALISKAKMLIVFQ